MPLLIAPSPLLSAAVASRSGFRERMTRDVRPSPNAMGPLWIRVPSSISYGNVITADGSSYRAMNIDCEWNSTRTRSPTRSMIAWKSTWLASASPISLMTASSALRSSVSPRRRFVSSNRRAFSSALAMLVAIVPRSRSVASSYACFSNVSIPMVPITRSPIRIGTPSHDSASRPSLAPGASGPVPGAEGSASLASDVLMTAPSATDSSSVPSRSGRLVRITWDVSPGPNAIGSLRYRRPSSISYGKSIMPVDSSYIEISIERALKRIRIRSPTCSMIDSKSSCLARASPISLMTASSAFRCRVSSMALARVSAEATCWPTKASRSRSACV